MTATRFLAMGFALGMVLATSAFGQTNGFCTNAVAMTLGTTYAIATAGVPSNGDPALGCGASIGHGVWYRLALTNDEQMLISTAGSAFPTSLAVYTGSCGALSNIACGSNGSVNGGAFVVFDGASHTTYYILAGGDYPFPLSGSLQLLASPGPATNDICAKAVTLTYNIPFAQDTTYATALSDLPAGDCGTNISHGVWFTVVLTNNQRVKITTAGSAFPTSLAVYTGSCGSLTNAGCNGNGSVNGGAAVDLKSAGGLTYHILAGNNYSSGDGGTLRMLLTNNLVPPIISLLDPTNETGRVSCVAVPFRLLAQVQPGSSAITNVIFYDNGTNYLGQVTHAPYGITSTALDHGVHLITAQALDSFGLSATSAQPTKITISYPTNLHILRADIATNGDFVGCMCAYPGSNYVIETATNVQVPAPWLAYLTNQVVANVLSFTNPSAGPRRFFRARLLQ